MKWFNRSLISVIIGCLNILTYTIVCGVLIINLKYYEYSEYDYNDYADVYESYKQRREAHNQREVYGSIYVVMCIIMDVVSGLLVWGVMEKRPRYIAPWILCSLIVLIYSTIVVMEDIFVKSSFQGVASSNAFFVALLLGFGLQLFCLAVVYSLYKDLELEFILKHCRPIAQDKQVQVDLLLNENHLSEKLILNENLSLPNKLKVIKVCKSRKSKEF